MICNGCGRPKFALGLCSRHYSRQRRGVTELASPQQDAAGLNRNNISGVRGVHWSTNHRRWTVSLRKNRVRFYNGTFEEDELEEAKAAAEALAAKLERELEKA